MLDIILKHKPDLMARDMFGRTPLHHACLNKNLGAVTHILKLAK